MLLACSRRVNKAAHNRFSARISTGVRRMREAHGCFLSHSLAGAPGVGFSGVIKSYLQYMTGITLLLLVYKAAYSHFGAKISTEVQKVQEAHVCYLSQSCRSPVTATSLLSSWHTDPAAGKVARLRNQGYRPLRRRCEHVITATALLDTWVCLFTRGSSRLTIAHCPPTTDFISILMDLQPSRGSMWISLCEICILVSSSRGWPWTASHCSTPFTETLYNLDNKYAISSLS